MKRLNAYPQIVTLFGFPPNAAMFSRTQWRAIDVVLADCLVIVLTSTHQVFDLSVPGWCYHFREFGRRTRIPKRLGGS